MAQDSITIDGVTIHVNQYETIMKTAELWRVPWETFVAANAKPEPKYKVGDWVVPLDWKPIQIDRIDFDGHDYYYHVPDGPGFTDASLRPATREDFMVEFGGVKVWMQRFENGGVLLHAEKAGKKVYSIRLYDWQVTAYSAANVKFMPEEFWKEK